MNTNWTPATIPDPSIVERAARREEEERGCSPIPYTFTPQERDVALLPKVDVIAMKQSFGQFTPGLVVIELQPSDLTEQERESFLRFGGVL